MQLTNEQLISFELIKIDSIENVGMKNCVDIQVEIDKLTISCTSSVGMANEEIFTQSEGKEVRLKFNPKFARSQPLLWLALSFVNFRLKQV